MLRFALCLEKSINCVPLVIGVEGVEKGQTHGLSKPVLPAPDDQV